MHETPEGFLVCVGVAIARTGVMDYADGETPIAAGEDGIVKISRDAEEVFKEVTIASFNGKPITIQHPKDFVSAENWKELAKGTIQNPRRGKGEQENDLIADLLITDAQAIALVKNGLREVSCGYEAEYVETGLGTGKQKNIIGNHLALVNEGRAGAAYAINDHKGKGSRMTFKEIKESLKALVKATETMDESAEKKEEKKEESKDAPADMPTVSYDDLMKAVKDMSEKLDMMKPKAADETKPATESSPAETVAKDEEVAPSMEDRVKKLEGLVEKLLEMQATDEEGVEVTGDEEAEEMEDEEMEEEVVVDEMEGALVGDSASRVEILAPGLKVKGKDFKQKALKVAYETADGKAVIDQFTGGKAPDLKNETFVDAVFIAASEMLKVKRNEQLSKTKTRDFQSVEEAPKKPTTPEELNKFNEKHYNNK